MSRVSNVLLRISRAWALLSMAFILLMIAGEIVYPHAPLPTPIEGVGMAFFPVGLSIGLIIGWRSEGLGGLIATGSMAGFYFWCLIVRGRFPGGPYFLLVAAPGILFLVTWLLRRIAKDGHQSAT